MSVDTTYTDPADLDRSTGQPLSATFWTQLASNVNAIAGSDGHIGARAYSSSNVAIGNNSETAVTLNAESYDTDPNGAIHDTGSNTSRMTIRTAGKYAIQGAGNWAANSTGQRLLKLRVNGTTTISQSTTITGNASYALGQQVVGVYDFAVNDYVELMAYQDSGGSLNLLQSGVVSIYLAVMKV